jgi:Zn-dependent protease
MRLGRAEASSGFFLMLAALLYFDTNNLILYALAAALLHEAAHLLAIKMKGGGVSDLHLSAFGAEIDLSGTYSMSFMDEAFIYLSGPAVNFIAAVFTSMLGNRLSSEEILAFSGMNLVIGIYNLLPVKMLDGGNALRSVSMHIFGKVIPVVNTLHVITVGVILTASCVFMFMYGFNLTLFFVSIYLLFGGMIDHRPVFRGLSNDLK